MHHVTRFEAQQHPAAYRQPQVERLEVVLRIRELPAESKRQDVYLQLGLRRWRRPLYFVEHHASIGAQGNDDRQRNEGPHLFQSRGPFDRR
ncbi:MAG: hypothetical protein Q7T05_01660, partial [Dehalococcoidia bacterium]|nr:hypothetical protein [Dehalococcoidia bacterium]